MPRKASATTVQKKPPTSKQIRVPVALEHHIRAYLEHLKSLDSIPAPIDFGAVESLQTRATALEGAMLAPYWEELYRIRETLLEVEAQINNG